MLIDEGNLAHELEVDRVGDIQSERVGGGILLEFDCVRHKVKADVVIRNRQRVNMIFEKIIRRKAYLAGRRTAQRESEIFGALEVLVVLDHDVKGGG